MAERTDFKPERADFKPEGVPVFYWTLSPLGPLPKKPDMRSKRADLKTEITDLWLIRSNWRPEKADLKHETAPKSALISHL